MSKLKDLIINSNGYWIDDNQLTQAMAQSNVPEVVIEEFEDCIDGNLSDTTSIVQQMNTFLNKTSLPFTVISAALSDDFAVWKCKVTIE